MNNSVLLFDSARIPRYICSGYRHFEPGKKHVNSTLNICMLVCVTEGILYYSQDGVPGSVSEGEWFIDRPLSVMRGSLPSPKLSFYYVHFEPLSVSNEEPGTEVIFSGGSEDEPQRTILRLPTRGTFDRNHFEPLFQEMDKVATLKSNDTLIRQSVFLKLISALAETAKPALPVRSRLGAKLYDYITMHACESFYVADLEKEFHFSPDYLSRILKEYCGMTAKELVMQLRVQNARNLLSYTTQSVEEISHQIGFQDVSQFHRAFKALTGTTPGLYRKQRG